MDWQLKAGRNGHIACTHGGECLAGLVMARRLNYVAEDEVAILAATAHAIKFSDFQNMYFNRTFPPEFEISPDPELINQPILVQPVGPVPEPGKPLFGTELTQFVITVSESIATALDLKKGPPL